MKKLEVKGMSCQHCVGSVTDALGKVPGVSDINVDLLAAQATFETDGSASEEDIKAAIVGIGFEVGEVAEA